MHSDSHRAWVEIDLGALVQNADALAARARVPLLAMVKADAYGLGAERVTGALDLPRVWGFGVATCEEGIALRQSGVRRPIVVFTPPLAHEFPELRAHQLTPALGDAAAIEAWTTGGREPWHLSVETGMNRAGVRWNRGAELLPLLKRSRPQGAFTHFHSPEVDPVSIHQQESRFREFLALLPSRPPLLHVANSAAIVRSARSEWDLIRPGIFLYGAGSGEGAALHPLPVATLRARIVEIHDLEAGDSVSYDASYRCSSPRRVATTALGYADGYRRSFSNIGKAEVHGRAVPVVGLVTMDMTMIDVTGVECSVGDVATFIGGEPTGRGGASITAVARSAGISAYELLSGLRLRLPRIYRDGR
jgi:alanine racemase